MTGQTTRIKYRTLERFLLCLLITLSIINVKIDMPVIGAVSLNRYVVVLMLLWRVQYGRRFRNDRMHQITVICWAIFLIAGLVTLAWTIDVTTASGVWIDFLFLFIIVIVILDFVRDEQDMRIALTIYTLCAVSIALLGIYENITGQYFHLTHVSYAARTNILGFHNSNTFFYNTNDMSSFVVAAIPVAFMCGNSYKSSRLLKVLFGLLLSMSVIFNASRGAVLGLIVFVALSLIIRRKSTVNILVLLLCTVFMLIFAEVLASTMLGQFFIEEGESGRFAIWINTLNNLKDSLFLGVGPGCASVSNSINQVFSTSIFAVHNYFLQMLTEFGVFGFVALMSWFIYLYIRIQRNRGKFQGQILRTSNYELSALFVFLAISITSSDMTNRPWIYVWFAILFAITKVLSYSTESEKHNSFTLKVNGEN